MKVYYIESGLQGCYLVRCLLPLQANGWNGDQVSIRLDAKEPFDKARAAQDAEVVVFHRPDNPKKLELARLLKQSGKKIVFDNDDTLKDDGGFKFNQYLDKKRFDKGFKTLNESIDAFIKEADLVTCSTEFLKKEYEKINPNVIVLPNCVDPFYFDEPLRNESEKIRIGIVGSIAITADLDVLRPIIEKYHKDPRVELVVFSLPPSKQDTFMHELYSEEYAFFESVNVQWQPFVMMENYYDTLNELRLDMMIIPRKDNYFNRCKSNLKFLEASMFEIPVIGQAFSTGDSPYQQNPEDSKRMLLADTHEQWIEQIEKLIGDKQLRLKMGKEAKEYVLQNYSIKNNSYKWKEAYQKMYAD